MNPMVAERYAQALGHIAQKKRVLPAVYRDMQQLEAACSRPLLVAWLRSPRVRIPSKERIMRKLEEHLHPTTLHFVLLVTRKGRAEWLPAIIAAFIAWHKRYQQTQVAYLTTAHPISRTMQERFTALVSKLSPSRDVALIARVDATLLGGYQLRVGHQLLDASLHSKLKRLSRSVACTY